ncbi:sodium ABC transporter ATP-binding protein, partial [Staphylococcus aureus]|nr:sodium ABC transporter ATP-binding protein [Staphylococcus aureus]
EELCDDFCILDKGQLVVYGDINHVRASNCNKKVVIESETTLPDLTNNRGIIHSENMKQGLQLTIENEDEAKEIYQVVAHQG